MDDGFAVAGGAVGLAETKAKCGDPSISSSAPVEVLKGADEGHCSEVVDAFWLSEGQTFRAVPGWFSELVRVLECDAAQVEGRAVRDILEDRCRSLDAELLAAAGSFEDSLGDEKHACAGFEGLHGGLEGEMSEEAEGHGDVTQDASAVGVAKDSGLAAGVDVGKEAKREIEAAKEGGGEARTARGFVECLIDLVRQGGEGIHHVDDFVAEELWDAVPERVLYGGGDGVGFVA